VEAARQQMGDALPEAASTVQDHVVQGLSMVSAKERAALQKTLKMMQNFVNENTNLLGATGQRVDQSAKRASNALQLANSNLGTVLAGLHQFDGEMQERLNAMQDELHNGVSPAKAENIAMQIQGSMGGARNVLTALGQKVDLADSSFKDEAGTMMAQVKYELSDMSSSFGQTYDAQYDATLELRNALKQAADDFTLHVEQVANEWKTLKRQFMEQKQALGHYGTTLDETAHQDAAAFRLQMRGTKSFRDQKIGSLVDSMTHLFASSTTALKRIDEITAEKREQMERRAYEEKSAIGRLEGSETIKTLRQIQSLDENIKHKQEMVQGVLKWAEDHAQLDKEFRAEVESAFTRLGENYTEGVHSMNESATEAVEEAALDAKTEEGAAAQEIAEATDAQHVEQQEIQKAEKEQLKDAGEEVEAKLKGFDARTQGVEDRAEKHMKQASDLHNKDVAKTISADEKLMQELERAGAIGGQLKDVMDKRDGAVKGKRDGLKDRLHDMLKAQGAVGGSLAQLDAKSVESLRASGLDEQGVHALLERRHHMLVEQLAGVTHATPRS